MTPSCLVRAQEAERDEGLEDSGMSRSTTLSEEDEIMLFHLFEMNNRTTSETWTPAVYQSTPESNFPSSHTSCQPPVTASSVLDTLHLDMERLKVLSSEMADRISQRSRHALSSLLKETSRSSQRKSSRKVNKAVRKRKPGPRNQKSVKPTSPTTPEHFRELLENIAQSVSDDIDESSPTHELSFSWTPSPFLSHNRAQREGDTEADSEPEREHNFDCSLDDKDKSGSP